jgi:hypothetical protein
VPEAIAKTTRKDAWSGVEVKFRKHQEVEPEQQMLRIARMMRLISTSFRLAKPARTVVVGTMKLVVYAVLYIRCPASSK